jgi:HEAT repeat protein
MMVGGQSETLARLARSEKEKELRLAAVRVVGLTHDSSELLVQLYRDDPDPDVRRQAIEGLFLANGASAIVELARAEQDPEMKKHLVQKLSLMQSEEATRYLLEILEQ